MRIIGKIAKTGEWKWECDLISKRFPQVNWEKLVEESVSDTER